MNDKNKIWQALGIQNSSRLTILYGVLNWGLGHASRSLPIIRGLINSGHRVLIASDGVALQLLEKSLPGEQFYELPLLDINYQSESEWKNVMSQSLNLFRHIQDDRRFVKKICETENIDLVISDHRLGFCVKGKENVLICHQLNLKAKSKLIESAINRVQLSFLSKFDKILVPDFENHRLSGELSYSKLKNVSFIEPLSNISLPDSSDFKYKYLAILSGPEPKRTILETKLLDIFSQCEDSCCLVRGTENAINTEIASNITIYNLCKKEELSNLISQSESLIARCGYSTIMDFYSTIKKVILIPTPGQPEQEYLATWHLQKGIFKIVLEENLSLKSIEY
ncbi:MAG TPA: glycosyltransferase family protein [Saprospiraceae bacterium]|nr:hypothetical protein [Lewinellaceae bacterium]HRX28456.1 glycosyltransferase family protein [Saprospiraceae bacterium]